MLKLTGGVKRGTILFVPEGHAIRPTPSRVREALFNSLGTQLHLPDCTVLDVFCGSGLMGLEAFSRGAPHITFMDQSFEAIAVTKRNAAKMNAPDSFTFYAADALSPPQTKKPCQVVFLDPPYGKGLGERALIALKKAGWIDATTLCILEESSTAALSLDPIFKIQKQRKYGITTLTFLTTTL